jgi:hypothetical protein
MPVTLAVLTVGKVGDFLQECKIAVTETGRITTAIIFRRCFIQSVIKVNISWS